MHLNPNILFTCISTISISPTKWKVFRNLIFKSQFSWTFKGAWKQKHRQYNKQTWENYLFLCIQYLLFLFHVPSQKLAHRINALEKTTWCSETKEEVRQVLTKEYTSSHESSYECDSDREEARCIQSEASLMGAV